MQLSESQPDRGFVDPAERRTAPRAACDAKARIYRTDGSNRMHEGFCTDHNEGGVGVDTSSVFAVGEVVEIELVSSRNGGQRRRARVLYRTSHHYGLFFL